VTTGERLTGGAPHRAPPPDREGWERTVTVGVAALTLVSGVLAGGLLGVLVINALGLDLDSLGATIAGFVALWAGFALVPGVIALQGDAAGLRRDLAPEIRLRDLAWIPLGLVVQPAAAIPYLLWDAATNTSTAERVGDAAEDLVDRAGSIGASFWILAVLVVVGAPLVEELVFRSMLQGSMLRAWRGRSVWISTIAPVLCSSLVFAAFHAQGLQFAALAIIGATLGLVHLRTRRLGPPFMVHLGFNLLAMIQLGLSLAD
jgi:hypothetical protein